MITVEVCVPVEDPIITPEEAASLLRQSRTRVYELIASKELASFKDGKRRFVSRASCVAWAEKKFAEQSVSVAS